MRRIRPRAGQLRKSVIALPHHAHPAVAPGHCRYRFDGIIAILILMARRIAYSLRMPCTPHILNHHIETAGCQKMRTEISGNRRYPILQIRGTIHNGGIGRFVIRPIYIGIKRNAVTQGNRYIKQDLHIHQIPTVQFFWHISYPPLFFSCTQRARAVSSGTSNPPTGTLDVVISAPSSSKQNVR